MDYKIETTATGYLVSVAGVGAQGADGQSAYLSAVEGGYTGSEAEFYALLSSFEQYASDAEAAATTSTDAAASAIGSAATATNRASAAATSATAAANSATAAATSASTANTAALSADSSKTAAASSATSAATSATAATTAKTGAETAGTIATDSAAAAATSATSASTSATSAATSASNANTSKVAAEQAKTDAQNYASAAATSASTASTAATTAATKASDSTNAAQAALNYAAASDTNATTAISKAAEATAAANTASTAATTATTKASEAATSANTASTAATTATDIANTIGVNNASINGAGHLIITRNNGSTIDAGTAKGDKGDKGDAGTGLKLKGTLPDVGSLPPSGNTEGDAWLISPNIWIYGASGWVNGGPIQGEKGEKGDKGDKGDTGDQGIQGLKGDKGDTGDNGAAATIAVGTVTTGAPGSSAIITNVGTTSAAVFDFTIPRGDAGVGSGNITGPGSSTNNSVALFDGISGDLLKDGGVLGTAAFEDVGDFASAAEGNLAMTAVQPGDLATVATTGAYADLSGKPTLSTVATTNDYNDLDNKPTIPAAQQQTDWTASSGVTSIVNKPAVIAAGSDATAARAAIGAGTGSGDVTLAGAQTLSNKTLTTPLITGTREVQVAMPANAIDLATGNLFTKTISGATTLTVSNVPATGTAVSFILELTNAGSAAITWFSGVKWDGGTAPTLTGSGVDVLGFYSHDGGTTWRGLLLSKDSK